MFTSTSVRRVLIGAGIAALSLFGDAAVSVADDSTCPSGYACVWTGRFFDGNKTRIPADDGRPGWHAFTNPKFSVKNHFTNRIIRLAVYSADRLMTRFVCPQGSM